MRVLKSKKYNKLYKHKKLKEVNSETREAILQSGKGYSKTYKDIRELVIELEEEIELENVKCCG